MSDFELIKALNRNSVCLEFDGKVHYASDLAKETGSLSEQDIIVLAKSGEAPVRLLTENEAAGRLLRKWSKD